MNVLEVVMIDEMHTIEFGNSTWNPEEMSVRNRFSTNRGNFSPHSSSEISFGDLELIMVEIARRDFLPINCTARIIQVLADSISRRVR